MNLTRLIAKQRFHYGTRRLSAGDEFEASKLHARLLVAAARAEYAEAEEKPKRPKLKLKPKRYWKPVAKADE
jgi:hypothetical protein